MIGCRGGGRSRYNATSSGLLLGYVVFMEWIWEVGKLVLAAGLGFGGGRAAVLLDRKHHKKEADLAKEADWRVDATEGDWWALTNVGTADASEVTVVFDDFVHMLSRPKSDVPKGESLGFHGARAGAAEVVVSWTNPRGERRGPVRRMIPPKFD